MVLFYSFSQKCCSENNIFVKKIRNLPPSQGKQIVLIPICRQPGNQRERAQRVQRRHVPVYHLWVLCGYDNKSFLPRTPQPTRNRIHRQQQAGEQCFRPGRITRLP